MSFYGLGCLASILSIYMVYLLLLQSHDNLLEDGAQTISVTERILKKPDNVEGVNDSSIALNQIQQVLDSQRRRIRQEMIGYQYPNGWYNISPNKLDNLVLEKGGIPIRSIVLSTWRSGSTFFGDILAAHPANFYNFEPLQDFGIVQIRSSPFAAKALKNIKALLNCDYTDLDHYVEYGKKYSWLFDHNTPLWRQCLAHKSICYNQRFLSGMCKLFPFQSMKLVRLRLQVAQELLADEKLPVKLVFLVRDPRGALQSGKHLSFCRKSRDCSDPTLHCADMVSDYNVAVELQKKYPTTFRVIRYEDLSLEPYEYVAELMKFYELNFHPSIKNFLDTHTKEDIGGVHSTFRNSKSAPFHWRTDLKFEEVEKIQRSCEVAMNSWGYVPAVNATHQREFNPITNYTL